MKIFYHIIRLAVVLTLHGASWAQTPSFYHLNTSNGLYDNHIRSLAIDGNGFLWIGTEEGLNRYDGQRVSVYLKDKYPGLPSDMITQIFCDSRKRVWIGTNNGAAWLDQTGHIHRVTRRDSAMTAPVKAFIEVRPYGTVIISAKGHYRYVDSLATWQDIPNAARLPFEKIKAIAAFGKEKAVFGLDSLVIIFDYQKQQVVRRIRVDGLLSLCLLRNSQLAVGKSTGDIDVIDPASGNLIHTISLKPASVDKFNTLEPQEIKQAANGDLVVGTGLNGLVTVTPSGIVTRYLHDPVNPHSLVSNSVFRVVTGANGEVVIGTSTSGVSSYNTRLNQAGFKGFFADRQGRHYDNYTGRMVESANNIFWIGTYDRLIRWDKKDNTSKFFYHKENGRQQQTRSEIIALCKDHAGRLWVSIGGTKIASFSGEEGFTELTNANVQPPLSKPFYVTGMMTDKTGLIWACSNKGVFNINPNTSKAFLPPYEKLVKTLSGKTVHSAFSDSKDRLWFSTIFSGLYCYDPKLDSLYHFGTKDGIPSDICYMVAEDKMGRFFITTSKGLAILSRDFAVRSLTKEKGLRYERCESVMIDNENIAWFSNKKCLVRFNADDNRLEFFDDKAGLLNQGFRVGSCVKAANGELLWGGYRGVSFFNPDNLKNSVLPLQVSIHRVAVDDSTVTLPKDIALNIDYSKTVTFGFAAVHLGIPGRTYYQYRLSPFDKNWEKGEDIQQARYTLLPPGKYVFETKASIDGRRWISAGHPVKIVIVPPLWMRWWFILAGILAAILVIYAAVHARNVAKRRRKQAADDEQTINYFASSLPEQQSVENILWDVAHNCIGRLGFTDCVVYLLDRQRNVLVQKAAFGPKNPRLFQIEHPLEIPVGQGIVGSVAQSGKAELIPNTARDNRYIMDDAPRLSEITVPLTWGGNVIGVIDCEHPRKNYFNQKHLSQLTTIASLCANKIVRARAEEERQKAQAILSTTEQKMAEVEMQALRAQMNPHFIFNCLNSINRYIVKSDQATASLYLTRFAKLIRLILENSGSKNVVLSNEIEALKLYIEMEALRFDKKFSYSVHIDRNVNMDSIELPPLIIQPYVENAIWHGLLHKDGNGQLNVTIKLADEGMLECVIEDNGVGRRKARELKSKSATTRKSLGMQLTESRLTLLSRYADPGAGISIVDLQDDQEQATGTKVILRIPV